MATSPPATFFERHDFLLRRLHSLSGLIPVGAFLVMHLVTNASVLNGAGSFQENVNRIHSLGVALTTVEWVFIFLPLIFHAVVGVVIINSGRPNTSSYAYVGNVRYTLQRVTAWIALFFILGHVFHMHGWFKSLRPVVEQLGGARFDPLFATSTAAAALQASVLLQIAYVVGILATVFHLANGLWTMGITWGVWTTPAAQQRANYACGGFGLLLAAVGLGALWGLLRVDPAEALRVEEQINAARVSSGQLDPRVLEEHGPHRDAGQGAVEARLDSTGLLNVPGGAGGSIE